MPALTARQRKLDRALSAAGATSDPMLLSELDGFLAGVLVCPDLILPSEWLPLVLSSGEDNTEVVFDNETQAQQLIALIMEHYNAMAEALNGGPGRLEPIFDVDERHNEVLWELWVDGFGQALKLRPATLLQITQAGDDEAVAALTGMAALLQIAAGESSLTDEEREALTLEAPDLIPEYIEALHAWRVAHHDTAVPPLSSILQAGSKVGRNDPCPCGSGKKYKKCCGLN